MKKKGFTLIELLAVIVVLAIIALIATPIVMNTIKRSKKGAAERSADSYVKQVEVAVATERLNGNILEGEYNINSDGNLTKDGKTYIVEMNGTKPTSGKIKITNGTVDQASSNMTIGDYTVSYNSTKKTYEATEKGSSTTTTLCTANTIKASALIYDDDGNMVSQEVGLLANESGAYAPGVTYTCELGDNTSNTFFVLEENGDNISLIAGFNLQEKVAWLSKEDYIAEGGTESEFGDYGVNYLGPITANKILKERTSGWTKLTESQISLPSANQIATASGKTFEDSAVYNLSTWLYGRIESNEGENGYWTSTPYTVSNNGAWNVSYWGYIGSDYYVAYDQEFGVRPVITVAKAQLG